MASDIEVTADVEGVTRADVVDALRSVRDGISNTSPVSAGFREAAVVASDESLTVRVQGHDGEWSQKSEAALKQAIAGVDGVQSIEVTEGGYDGGVADTEPADDDDTTAEDGDEEDVAADVAEIDGVGPARAEELRAAGIETVGQVISGGVDGLIEAGLSDGVAENVLAAATDFS